MSVSTKSDYIVNNNLKQNILQQLNILLNDKKSKGETFRVRAYVNAINAIKEYHGDIESVKDLDKISGLAKGSIKKRIKEFIENGIIPQVNNIKEESDILHKLNNIYGVGPSKSNELIEKHNISSIDNLRNKYEKDNTILNNKQKIGLDYYEDLLKRIPRNEMKKHEDFIINLIKNIDVNDDLIYEVTGSYRRGTPNSGDIDVLCTTKNDDNKLFNKIIEKLELEKYIEETLAKGEKKFMGICKLYRHRTSRRLDMIYTQKENYPFALLYFTGSGQFNIEMRNHALSLGYSLNEYGLKNSKGENKDKLVDHKFKTEEDIFDFLDIKYIKPSDRKGGIINKYLN
jgi:DNA polymerase beta